ncbi:uncharacterized protein LOC126824705 [Patella vulgata]|uniref:uncharacterized protein LOC126824705 n=1 Tax=Patella vulgata TaxID=6465 RepID=UPI00217F35CC|nr:uncharacterized protein LOC126824705 [Patella vulgata]
MNVSHCYKLMKVQNKYSSFFRKISVLTKHIAVSNRYYSYIHTRLLGEQYQFRRCSNIKKRLLLISRYQQFFKCFLLRTTFRNYSTKDRSKIDSENDVDNPKLNYIFVQSSKDRWEDVPNGIMIDLAYTDSCPEEKYIAKNKGKIPIILALHDSPGSHYDLLPLLKPFMKTGCRVIAPNFPGFGITGAVDKGADNIFSHTTDEKAELVMGLLDNLDINSIDLLIASGAGTYPALRLSTEVDINVKSLAFINPWPHSIFRGIADVLNQSHTVTSLWDRPFYHVIARIFVWLTKNRLNVKVRSVNEAIKYLYTVHGISFNEIGGLLVTLRQKNIPRTIFYAENSSFVEPEILKAYLDLLGIDIEDRIEIDSTGKIINKGSNNLVNSVSIQTENNEIISQYSGIINGILNNFMHHVSKR